MHLMIIDLPFDPNDGPMWDVQAPDPSRVIGGYTKRIPPALQIAGRAGRAKTVHVLVLEVDPTQPMKPRHYVALPPKTVVDTKQPDSPFETIEHRWTFVNPDTASSFSIYEGTVKPQAADPEPG